jgi:hypothetical protein
MKQAKFQWLLNPSQMNGDSLSNVKSKASKHFGNKREYEKENLWAWNKCKNKSTADVYRGIDEFKKCYKPGTNVLSARKVICLQIPTMSSIGGSNTIFVRY